MHVRRVPDYRQSTKPVCLHRVRLLPLQVRKAPHPLRTHPENDNAFRIVGLHVFR